MSWVFTIDNTNRRDMLGLVRDAPAGWRFALERPIYTDLQRMKFNAMCGDLAKQVLWDGEQLSATEWKHWLTAAWKQQRMVRGMEPGTIVFVGEGLQKKSAATVSNLIELAYWFGTQQGVEWSEKAKHTPADPEGPAQLEEGTEA
jgi:hypothetical protein